MFVVDEDKSWMVRGVAIPSIPPTYFPSFLAFSICYMRGWGSIASKVVIGHEELSCCVSDHLAG